MIRTLVVCILFLAPRATLAQDSVRLRFAPPEGADVHRLFQRFTRTVMLTPDGARRARESAQLGGARQVTLASGGSVSTVHLAFDSLRIRTREDDGPWFEATAGGADTLWIQVSADDRLDLQWPEGVPTHPQAELLVRLLTGFPGMVLPDRWLTERQQWRAELGLGQDDVGAGAEGGGAVRLVARAVIVVDSITQRSRDTLAFLGIQGSVVPTTLRTADGMRLRYEGAISGTLVWSTGWASIVSAATRSTVTIEMQRVSEAGGLGTVIVESTLRQAVVP